MKKAGKVWGQTEEIVKNGSLELHRIEIEPNTQCSVHSHRYKWNGFYVEKGRVLIRERMDYGNGNELWDETVLGVGEYHEVRPGHDHQFVAVSDEMTIVYEIYFAHFDHDDIQRKTVGGVLGKVDSLENLVPANPDKLEGGMPVRNG